jgi:hypothetical protein
MARLNSLFPNTVLRFRGIMLNSHECFRAKGADRAVIDLGLYVPNAPKTADERTHWDKNMQLVLDVVTVSERTNMSSLRE